MRSNANNSLDDGVRHRLASYMHFVPEIDSEVWILIDRAHPLCQ